LMYVAAVAANAGTLEGRFYWKGILVEDEK
jgi:hypothetical protein